MGHTGGDLIDLFATIHGLTLHEAYDQLTDGNPLPSAPETRPKPEKKRIPFGATDKKPPVYGEKSWIYTNAEGKYQMGVCYVGRKPNGKKDFRQCAWDEGNKKWVWQAAPDGRPLYIDWEKLKTASQVLIVEGEKCADVASPLLPPSIVVATWPGGGSATKRTDWAPLRGKDILIWPDDDDPGRKTAKNIAEILSPYCSTVEIIKNNNDDSFDIADLAPEAFTDIKKFISTAGKEMYSPSHEETPLSPEEITGGCVQDAMEISGSTEELGTNVLINMREREDELKKSATQGSDTWGIETFKFTGKTVTVKDGHRFPKKGVRNYSMKGIDLKTLTLSFRKEKPPIIRASEANFQKIIDHFWGDSFRLNSDDGIVYTNFPGRPTFTPIDKTTINHIWLKTQDDFQIMNNVKKSQVEAIVLACAHKRPFSPITDFYKSLPPWDGLPRVEDFFYIYMDADRNDINKEIATNMLVAILARMKGEAKVDFMPIFYGPQGVKKSWALEALGGEFYTSLDKVKIASDDATRMIRGKVIVELPELTALAGLDEEAKKSVISNKHDNIVQKYAETNTTQLRRCIYFGTTNKKDILGDSTGARRYPIVSVSKNKGHAKVEAIENDRLQIFAEAKKLLNDGHKYWDFPLLKKAQADFQVVDPWIEIINEKLANDQFSAQPRQPRPRY